MGKSGSFVLYPDGDPDNSQNLMGSKLNKHPSSAFRKIQTLVVV